MCAIKVADKGIKHKLSRTNIKPFIKFKDNQKSTKFYIYNYTNQDIVPQKEIENTTNNDFKI